ncbi:MAG: chromate transporter [Propionibacteriaceae bacterium]
MSDRAFADLVALCQFLPGPASSQVGMAIGLQRAGAAGYLLKDVTPDDLLAKLGARDRSQLVVLSYESGLIAPGDGSD